jgi:hypothetical protein
VAIIFHSMGGMPGSNEKKYRSLEQFYRERGDLRPFPPAGAGQQASGRAGNARALDLTLPAADAVGHNPAPRRLNRG